MQTTVAGEIERATLEVFASMIGVDVVRQVPSYQPLLPDQLSVVSCLSLSGRIRGTARFCCTLSMATCITCRMLEVDPPLDAAEIFDAAGEIANMIIGSAKSCLEAHWGAISLGTPSTDMTADHESGASSLHVHFRCGAEMLMVSVALHPTA
jgi:CheY-specific phosphatase CheX